MGAAVACGEMVREKDQKGRCEEEEQEGSDQCPQDVLAALLTTGPIATRVPAGGEGGGGGGRIGGGVGGRLVRDGVVRV